MRAFVCWLAILLGLSWSGQLQAQTAAPGDHIARVRVLLGDPKPTDVNWRKMLFQSVRRLEFGPQELVTAAWQALDLPGDDRGHSNLLVYLRRHGLPLPAPRVDEAADSLLERALAAWGALDFSSARSQLEEGSRRFPQDARFTNNLPWLPVVPVPPTRVDAAAGGRELAFAVLALRLSRS